MISDRMRGLVCKLDFAAWDAGFRRGEDHALDYTDVINARIDLIMAIDDLEAQIRGRRETVIREIIDDDMAASFSEPRTSEML